MRRETRSQVGLVAPASRPRFPGPLRGVTAHWNGPAMGLAGQPHSECQRRWRGTQRFHMGNNHPNPQPNGRHWQDVAYTYAVCHHEIAMDGRGKGVRTAANGTNHGNNTWYACFFLVGGREEPSPQMLRAAAWYARVHLGTTTWNRHTDHKATTCAGTVNKHVSGGRLLAPVLSEPDLEEIMEQKRLIAVEGEGNTRRELIVDPDDPRGYAARLVPNRAVADTIAGDDWPDHVVEFSRRDTERIRLLGRPW